MSRELFTTQKNKIVSFEQDSEFFYRKAEQFRDENKYVEALRYYRMAVEKESGNVDYLFSLAETYTEMLCFPQSNEVLYSSLQNNDVIPECYFLLGCNFIGLHKLDRAEEFFEKYLEVSDHEILAEYVIDEIEDLREQYEREQANDDYCCSHCEPEYVRMYELIQRGEELILDGKYHKAMEIFEKVDVSHLPDATMKSNFAMMYYYGGNKEKAIEILETAIEDAPTDTNLIYNLATILCKTGQKDRAERYVEQLIELESLDDMESIGKIITLLTELGKHEEVYRYVKLFRQYVPYNSEILHFLAVASFNLGRYKVALHYWNKIEDIYPGDTIATYYKKYAHQVIDDESLFKEIPYRYRLPSEEFNRRMIKVKEYATMPFQDREKMWKESDSLYRLLHWALNYHRADLKKQFLIDISKFNDQDAELFLRTFALREHEPEELKRLALALLKKMGAKEPYFAYLDSEPTEIKVDMLNIGNIEIAEEYKKIPQFTIDEMVDRYDRGYENFIQRLWFKFVMELYPEKLPRVHKIETWAATLEYYYCIKHSIDITKKELIKRYGVSNNSINNNLEKLKKVTDK